MIAGVWSDDPERQLRSAGWIRIHVSQDTPDAPMEAALLDACMPRLVEFLKKDEYPALQHEVAWALRNLAATNAEEVVRNNAVPVLAQLLDSREDEVREQAAWALRNVAADSRYGDHVLQYCGALKRLLILLLYEDETKLWTLRSGTLTLLDLCRGTPRLNFDKALMKPTFGRLLSLEDEDILKHACLALWHMSKAKDNGIQNVIDSGLVPKLLNILQHTSPKVLQAALRTIGTLVSGDDQQTQFVIDRGALSILYNLLTRNYENNTIKMVTCWTISNITEGTREQIQSVIDANLIPALVNLAQDSEFVMAKEATWAISNVTGHASPEQIKYMVEQSCIKPICDTMICPDTSTTLRCLSGLENILKAGEAEKKKEGDVNCYCEVIEDAEGLRKIYSLQYHVSDKIKEMAVKIMKTYEYDWVQVSRWY